MKMRASTARPEKLCEDRKGDFDSISSYRLGSKDSSSVKLGERRSKSYLTVYIDSSSSRQGLRRLSVHRRIKADFQKSRTRLVGCGYVVFRAKLHLVPLTPHPDQLVSQSSHPATWFLRAVPVL
jgi:hypothetical protein